MSARRCRLTARTRIGGQNELEARWVASMHLATSERDDAGLEWGTKRLDDSRLELRRFIQKKNTLVGQSVIRFYELDII